MDFEQDYSGRSYELGMSDNQKLTFRVLKEQMKKSSLSLGAQQMKTLKLIGEDGIYTNLAMLLSDQCTATTKVAVFQGEDKAVLKDKREFTGSVLKQLDDVYQFIDELNKNQSRFSGLYQIDTRDYPDEAIQEALVNATVHRDYSLGGSNIISIYDDRIEFVSQGGLVPSLELKSIFMGVSQTRNPLLFAIFCHMQLTDGYGIGIEKISRSYKNHSDRPKFETAGGVFRVTLPACNEIKTEADHVMRIADSAQLKDTYMLSTPSIDAQKDKIIRRVREQGGITRREVETLIGAGTTKAYHLLKELCDEGRLREEERGRLRRYVICER